MVSKPFTTLLHRGFSPRKVSKLGGIDSIPSHHLARREREREEPKKIVGLANIGRTTHGKK